MNEPSGRTETVFTRFGSGKGVGGAGGAAVGPTVPPPGVIDVGSAAAAGEGEAAAEASDRDGGAELAGAGGFVEAAGAGPD
jgi:hypothetical protein